MIEIGKINKQADQIKPARETALVLYILFKPVNNSLALPAFLAELSLTYWLMFKNSDVEMRYNRTSESA